MNFKTDDFVIYTHYHW